MRLALLLLRTPAMPKTAEPWSLNGLREKLIKIGAQVVSHGRFRNRRSARDDTVGRLVYSQPTALAPPITW
jgi:hypothetical protein